MAAGDPREAIMEHLREPPRSRPAPQSDPASTTPVASVAGGNPFAADLTTIEFVKERSIPGRSLCALRFDDLDAHRWCWLAAAEQDESGQWVGFGVAGGSGNAPDRSSPWLNLAGLWGGDRFYAGGTIEPAGARVGQVRLTLASGAVLTDDAEGDVALFLTREGHEPVAVDIYDRDERHICRHSAF
jgi:hypothetical protein